VAWKGNVIVNYEPERMWKKAAMSMLWYNQIFLGATKENREKSK
jgi:hypothetical protein